MPVRALRFRDETEEAGWIVDDLKADHKETGLPWGEYAILYRQHKSSSLLEDALVASYPLPVGSWEVG